MILGKTVKKYNFPLELSVSFSISLTSLIQESRVVGRGEEEKKQTNKNKEKKSPKAFFSITIQIPGYSSLAQSPCDKHDTDLPSPTEYYVVYLA